MPISKDPSQRGVLRIHFQIQFPTYLDENQKNGIRRHLHA